MRYVLPNRKLYDKNYLLITNDQGTPPPLHSIVLMIYIGGISVVIYLH